jgi:L-serine dehydratase
MRAARRFAESLREAGLLSRVARVEARLYGSLARTGKGHASDRASVLGLAGEAPETVRPEAGATLAAEVAATRRVRLLGEREVRFDPARDLLFVCEGGPSEHPNGMWFGAYDGAGVELHSGVAYSIGGGFVAPAGAREPSSAPRALPFPFADSASMLRYGVEAGLPIWRLVLANESCSRTEPEIRERARLVWGEMKRCAGRGMAAAGSLPGGLEVTRRARRLGETLSATAHLHDPLDVLDFVSVFAIAVSEENAAGGRVVTAPTNGAAGVIPAVLHYYERFLSGDEEGVLRFLLAASAVGSLYRENASISGAEVGCQGEIGVASSMAAAGLMSAIGGGNEQVEHAAEIAMEHHLGLTCDPVGGLVQIPCIERNAFGAVTAIIASRIAARDTGAHKVSLDQVIRTMHQTGLDMRSSYKETSLAGLAVNVPAC